MIKSWISSQNVLKISHVKSILIMIYIDFPEKGGIFPPEIATPLCECSTGCAQ